MTTALMRKKHGLKFLQKTLEDTIYINADKDARLATYTQEGNVITAENDNKPETVAIGEGEEITVTFKNFDKTTTITGANGTQFQAADTEFTAGITTITAGEGEEEDAETFDTTNAKDITLVEGTLANLTSEQKVTVAGSEQAVEVGTTYTITYEADDIKVSLTNVIGGGAIKIVGLEDSTADTDDNSVTQSVTYTFGDGAQTFVIEGDADGVVFTVDENGFVKDISDLKQGATIAVTSDGTLTVNDAEFTDISGKTVVGTADSAALVYDEGNVYIEVVDGVATFYGIDESGAIDKENAVVVGGVDSIELDGTTLTLPDTLVPTEKVKLVIANNTGAELEVNNASDAFIKSMSDGANVRINTLSELEIVKSDGETVETVTSLSDVTATVELDANKTLILGGETKVSTGAEGEGTVVVEDGKVELTGAEMTVTGAAADTEITLNQVEDAESTVYTIGEDKFNVISESATVQDAKLTAGTVALNSEIAKVSTANETIEFVGNTAEAGEEEEEAPADAQITVDVATDNTVTIGEIDSGDSFKVNDNEYKMTEIGLVSGDKIWNGEDAITDEATTAQLDTTSADWATMISDKDGVVDIADIDTGVTNAVIVDDVTNPTTRLGSVVIAEDGITVTSESEDLTGINLGADAVTLNTVDFAGDITTASGSATYTIKVGEDDAVAFEASDSELTINVGEGATLKDGKVIIPSVAEDADGFAIYGGQTVKVTGDDSGVEVTVAFDEDEDTSAVNSITDLNANGTVEYGGNTYTIKNGLLIVTGGDDPEYYRGANESTNILAPEGDKVAYVQIGDEGLDVSAGIAKLADDEEIKEVLYGEAEESDFDGTYQVSMKKVEDEEGSYKLTKAADATC